MSTTLATRVNSMALPLSHSHSPPSTISLWRPSPVTRPRSLASRAAATVSANLVVAVPLPANRTVVRIGLPSKGRMAEQTLSLLKSCQLPVRQLSPRQYTAEIPMIQNLEVWFQRPKDIVRKLQSGDLDLGIVGFDIVSEYRHRNDDLVIVHDALEFGHCRLSLAVAKEGIFENINSLEDLAKMPEWTEERPLRVVTGFRYLGAQFLKENGFNHVLFLSADGALESFPLMGMADAIVDLVSSGMTLQENNLKELKGGVVLESQATLVASRRSLHKRKGVLDITRELVERLEAHLGASAELMVILILYIVHDDYMILLAWLLNLLHFPLSYKVTANMRGSSAEEVQERVVRQTSICGLQESTGPTVSPVYCRRDGKVAVEYYAINVIGGSGVLATKQLTYIFEEEAPRWRNLLSELGF
ncbi:hypothetical protein ACP70R_013384 [Stipagrostis hirtigluma subsp. patula]